MKNFKKNISRATRFLGRKLDRVNPYAMVGRSYVKRINKKEFEHPPFSVPNERPVEYGFVFRAIAAFYPKSILDIGTGVTALPHLMANCGARVTALDNIKDYWPEGMWNRHYHIVNDDIIKPKLQEKFDMVTCVSTLEHIEAFDQAVDSMFRLLNPGGHLILTFPYTENTFVPNVYDLPGTNANQSAFRTHSYSRKNLDAWLARNNAAIVAQEYWQFWSGDFWTVGDRLEMPKQVSQGDKHQLSCIVMEKK